MQPVLCRATFRGAKIRRRIRPRPKMRSAQDQSPERLRPRAGGMALMADTIAPANLQRDVTDKDTLWSAFDAGDDVGSDGLMLGIHKIGVAH